MKWCSGCGAHKRERHFRYIEYFDARRRICKRCEARERQIERHRVAKHVSETGFTPGILRRLEAQARKRAAIQAEQEILSALSDAQLRAFRTAQRLERASNIVFILCLVGLVGVWFLGSNSLVVLPLLIGMTSILARVYVRRVHTGPRYEEISRRGWVLIPVILEEEKRRRVEFEQFYASPEWRILRRTVLQTQRRSNGHFTCHYCQGSVAFDELTVDHFKPRSKFPDLALTMSNLRIACRQCNSVKGTAVFPEAYEIA